MQFTDKDPSETVLLGVDFANVLADGETLTSAQVAIRAVDGTNTSASMLSGSPSIAGSTVRHAVVGGVAGMDYVLSFSVNTSLSQSLVEGANLSVRERD